MCLAYFSYILLLFHFADELKAYFEQFGKVVEVSLKKDHETGLPRGFGFVGFADPAAVDEVDNRNKRAILYQMSFFLFFCIHGISSQDLTLLLRTWINAIHQNKAVCLYR